MQLAFFGDAQQWKRREYVPQGLGLIPSWQYSADPGVNIKLNPGVKFPPGWSQTTVQPVDNSCCQPRADLQGLFDSWAWVNRKWLVLGGAGLLTAALGVGAVALLR